MAEPSGDRVIAAQITRTADGGDAETVPGLLAFSMEPPLFEVTLSSGFPSDGQEMDSFLTGADEIQRYPLLHLQTSEGFFTAIDSRVVRSKTTWGGESLSEIVLQPMFLIKGSVFLWDHELSLTEATIRFWDQNEWAEWFAWTMKRGTPEEPDVIVTQVGKPTLTAEVNGATVLFEDASPSAYYPIGKGEVTLTQSSRFRVKFEQPVPLREFMREWLRPLGFLVSSGTRRTSGIESLSITNREWKSDRDGSLLNTWLQVMPRNPRRPERPGRDKFLHHLKDFDFDSQVQTVFDTHVSHHAAIEQYLDYIHRKPATPMVRLTLLAQLVETFDRSLNPDPDLTPALEAKATEASAAVSAVPGLTQFAAAVQRAVRDSLRPSLSHRLSRMDKEVGGIVSEALGQKTWKNDIPLVRNAVVHGLSSANFFTTNLIPLQVAEAILDLLFEARLLVALGFESAAVKKILTENDPNWWGRRADIVNYLSSFNDFKKYKH